MAKKRTQTEKIEEVDETRIEETPIETAPENEVVNEPVVDEPEQAEEIKNIPSEDATEEVENIEETDDEVESENDNDTTTPEYPNEVLHILKTFNRYPELYITKFGGAFTPEHKPAPELGAILYKNPFYKH